MSKTKGRVTLPSESNFYEETREMLDRWGADALRDSDGTKLDEQLKSLDAKIYTTYFVARGHNEFAEKHMEECQQIYLLSEPVTAYQEETELYFAKGYYEEQVIPDYIHDPKQWWEVMDRTTNQTVPAEDWELDSDSHKVLLKHAVLFHEYTVTFLAYAIWDPTQMYNHITNDWGDKPHEIPFDIRHESSWNFAKEYLVQWLKDNPSTDVVRFTTFFYHFTLVFNDRRKQKFVEWVGYGGTVSTKALEEFQAEYGYRPRPEMFVDQGYYNSSFRVPSKEYLEYQDFIQRFVAKKAKELVELVHEAGREAMMFLGDNWIGTEPYGKYFSEIGLDAVVGSVGDGMTLRLISDIPGVKYTEGRFLPYFFPDTFYEGNDPCVEAVDNWLCARRALMRKPVDRIGYGGYLSLAYKFPKFVDYIEHVTDEFREIYGNIKGKKPYCGCRVAILNAWGKVRSWQSFIVAHGLKAKQIYSYLGILESLSGASVDVSFLSFQDIRDFGVPKEVDVIINAGDALTAYSGGENWLDQELVTKIRSWVHAGGGFVGVGEPAAYPSGIHYFQLADVLGVDKELGFSLSSTKYFWEVEKEHFITEDAGKIDFGESMHNVYAISDQTRILECSEGEIHLAAHDYGKGRGVYIAGLPYSVENTRLLLRSIFYAAGRENQMKQWYASNLRCEVHAYPESGKYAVLNNSNQSQDTEVYDGEGNMERYHLEPCAIVWKEI